MPSATYRGNNGQAHGTMGGHAYVSYVASYIHVERVKALEIPTERCTH